MSFTLRCLIGVPLLVLAVLISPPGVLRGDWAEPTKFFDDGTLALWAASPLGETEDLVQIYHNYFPIGAYQVIEAYDQVPGTTSYPLTFVDLPANTFLRLTYQKPDETTATLGTSVVGSPSFRTSQGLQYIPTVTHSYVSTSGGQRYENVIEGDFGSGTTVTSTRIFPDPIIGRSTVDLSISFQTQEAIDLATGAPYSHNDRLRVLTASSMFGSSTRFNANAVRYETSDGAVETVFLTNDTPRDEYLLHDDVGRSRPDEIGGWFEMIRGPGSLWAPDSPTIRVDILDRDDLRLGIQGFLAESSHPNDDSLSVYLEVMDAPDRLPATQFDVSFRITAIPEPIPEPSTLSLLTLGALCLVVWARRRR